MNVCAERLLRKRYTWLPKDFVETESGWLWAVVAAGLEDQRVLATLRYMPVDDGLRKLSTVQAQAAIRQHWPQWMLQSSTRDVSLPGIPVPHVRRHCQPAQFFDRLGRAATPEHLAPRVRLAHELRELLCPDQISLGITGSTLIHAGHASSDLDLVVYGEDAIEICRDRVRQLLQQGRLDALTDSQWRTTHRRRGCDMPFDEYHWHELRKYNKFSKYGIKVDLSCVTDTHPWVQPAGRKLTRIRLRANVTDDRHAYGYPAVYGIDDPRVRAILSYTATYTGQARQGETIEVAGWLEDCGDFQRVLVGSSREASGEMIRVVAPVEPD